jgi:hypothetical protein
MRWLDECSAEAFGEALLVVAPQLAARSSALGIDPDAPFPGHLGSSAR